MSRDDSTPSKPPAGLSSAACFTVLATAFLGWMFAGVQLAISSLVMRDAAKSLLPTGVDEAEIGLWFSWLIAAFLLGAALGGYVFGWIGDRMGRARAMGLSILCYSVFAGLTYFVTEPWQLLALRFLTCMGIGGMWPNGIALVSEAWPNVSRPFLAGAIGTAANVGIMLFSALCCFVYVSPDNWRWVMLLGLSPAALAAFTFAFVPESPRWLALQQDADAESTPQQPAAASLLDVFTPPVLRITLVGILLGTVPLFGGWGSSNWANAWAAQKGDKAKQAPAEPGSATNSEDDGEPAKSPPTKSKSGPALKAQISLSRSLPGSISSLLGSALAVLFGRRRFYFFVSVACLGCSQYLFWMLEPGQTQFLIVYGALGFFSGFFFGWLPLCLPELFPTRVRATGAGVSFNFGRILTAIGVLAGGAFLKWLFDGNYALIGVYTSYIYALGMVVVFLIPRQAEQTIGD